MTHFEVGSRVSANGKLGTVREISSRTADKTASAVWVEWDDDPSGWDLKTVRSISIAK
jgi:hypothetical protein